MITDKNLLKSRFGANFAQYNKLAVVQDAICGELDLLTARVMAGVPRRALEVGAGTGFLTRRLLMRFPDTEWVLNDLSEKSAAYLRPMAEGHHATMLWGDAESVELPAGLDLIASASTVQWFDDLKLFVARAREVLAADGVLAFSTFGPDNFGEIRVAAGEGLDYFTVGQLRAMVEESGYTVLHVSEYTRRLLFDTPADVLRHIKATGVNSIRRERWTRRRLAEFENLYRSRFALDDGRVTLTYHPVLLAALKR